MYEISEEKFYSILSKAGEFSETTFGFCFDFETKDGGFATMWLSRFERVKSTRRWFKTTRNYHYEYECMVTMGGDLDVSLSINDALYDKAFNEFNKRKLSILNNL